MSLSPGTRLGAYEILAPLGAGGMGEVYRARDTRLKRDIAIKVLPDAWVHDKDRLLRFQREAELLAALNHPNIASIHGVEESAGATALLLEFVDGPTLADLILRGPIPLDAALPIISQIAEALDAAHERGIVHRDLKPANIKVREDGTVKVLDFGLAKALEGESAAPDASQSPTVTIPARTRAGVLLGTAAYMSPEQARGHVVDRRTDIWAFGCVVYEMLAGRPVFAGETTSDTIAAILQREPDWSLLPASTPPALRTVVRRCLEKDRKRRLRDIGDARVDLDVSIREDDRRESARAAASDPGVWKRIVAAFMLIVASVAATLGVQALRTRANVSLSEAAKPRYDLVRATADAGVTADPTLSRDGTQLAYASDRAGAENLDIWVQQTAGSEPRQVTRDPADEYEPAFSKDGTQLAYRSQRDGGGIYISPSWGGQEPRLLVSRGRRPRFSPLGDLVVYWEGSAVGFSSNSGAYRTFVIPADLREPPREITGFTGARYPVWAPDGQSLLLLGSRDAPPEAETYDWWRVPLDGAAPTPLRVNALLAEAGIAFETGDVHPDDWQGDQVLFSDGRFLWRMRLDPGSNAVSNVERLTFGTNQEFQASSTEQGLIAFASASASNGVWAQPLDPVRGVAKGAPRRLTAGVGVESRPSASRDGQVVAYRSAIPKPTIHIRNLGTQRLIDVGFPGSAFGPAISPDGTQVAYEEDEGVRVVPTRGGTPWRLCDDCAVGDWVSDSQSMVVVKPENNAGRLTKVSLSGEFHDLIVSPDETVNRPFPSPDERWLAFRRMGPSGQRILIAPLTTEQPVPPSAWIQLVAPEADARPSGWSPDSSLVYFVSARDGTRCLYAQRINGATGAAIGEPLVVQHFHGGRNVYRAGLNVLSTGPANAVAGGLFFYDLSDLTANIWLMHAR